MLQRPEAGVPELSELLALPEGQVSAALDGLCDSTLLRPSREHPGTFRVIDPAVALDHALRRQEQELADRQIQLAQAKAAALRALSGYTQDTPADGTPEHPALRLVGLDAIQNQLEVLGRQVRDECLAVMPGGAQSAASLDASRPLDTDALRRGVAMRTLYQDSVRNDAPTLAYAKWLTEQGGQVRTAPLLPPRMLVFDRRIALIPLDPSNTRAGALRTEEPAVIGNLLTLFEQFWQTAVPLGTRTSGTGDGLSATERELLKLLAGGITDEGAARRLGVSLRTVRRQMASLMERLEATSRFEAGLKAARRGWL
ncbi:LuxR C-terminal-related transcriptional regulator [Streptomyces sp. J2-1]|nr:LuxR C-terminal-related transcriptional regulator [Streptomyces corallincola]